MSVLSRHSCVAGAITLSLWAQPCLAQSDDCNGDGISDSTQFGQNYAVWAPSTGDGSGLLTAPDNWCPAVFNNSTRLIFDHDPQQGVGIVDYSSFWGADSIWFYGGNWKLQAPSSVYFDLYANIDPTEGLRIVDSLTWDCWGNIGGPAFIGRSGLPGTLLLVGGSFYCYFAINIGTEAVATATISGGTMSGQVIRIGAPDTSTSTHGSMRVHTGGVLIPFDRVDLADFMLVNGLVSGTVRGAALSPQGGATLTGSGKVERLETNLMRVVPSPGLGADGKFDSTLTVGDAFVMTDLMSGQSGTLEIRPFSGSDGTMQVPRIEATSATLGGLLRVVFGAGESNAVSDAPIVKASQSLVGSFSCVQPVGLPDGRTIRLTPSVDGAGILMSVINTMPPPAVGIGQPVSLQRVATDGGAADLDGDGDLDVFVALEQDSQGMSGIRLLKTDTSGQSVVGTVSFPGQIRMVTPFKFVGDTLPSLAATLGDADQIALLRNLGDWSFAVTMVSLLPGDNPSGIASGAFVEAATGLQSELAVGCPGSARVYILGAGTQGAYTVLRTFEGLGGDIVRAAELDGTGMQDLVVTDRLGNKVFAVSGLADLQQGPTVQLMPLPSAPVALSIANFGDSSTARSSAVVALEGTNSTPDDSDPLLNIAILRPGIDAFRVPALLAAGSDAQSVSAGDIDGDGLIDLAVAATFDGTEEVRFLMNTSNRDDPAGPLVFSCDIVSGEAMTGVTRPRSVWMADVFNDGTSEVITLSAGNPQGSSLGPVWEEGMGSMGGGGSCTAGDFDCDGDVDGGDLATLLGSWGACSGCVADIDENGAVDGGDLATVLGNWG
ncbi:MAG: hypothetical protein O2855_06480 [Planctomycetota bacterium]|nr:hypothetical protein [Planctomycetota bacterium]